MGCISVSPSLSRVGAALAFFLSFGLGVPEVWPGERWWVRLEVFVGDSRREEGALLEEAMKEVMEDCLWGPPPTSGVTGGLLGSLEPRFRIPVICLGASGASLA